MVRLHGLRLELFSHDGKLLFSHQFKDAFVIDNSPSSLELVRYSSVSVQEVRFFDGMYFLQQCRVYLLWSTVSPFTESSLASI